MTLPRVRCKVTGPEHERLRYGLVEWTPEDGSVTRLRATPGDDPWYEKPRPEQYQGSDDLRETGQDYESRELLDCRRSDRAKIPATSFAEKGYPRCPSLIHKLWITLRIPLEGAPLPRRDLRLSLLTGSQVRRGTSQDAGVSSWYDSGAISGLRVRRREGESPPTWTAGIRWTGPRDNDLDPGSHAGGKGRGRQPHRECLTM